MDQPRAFDRRLTLLVAIGLPIVYLALVATSFGPYITEAHGFRQAQTAISARYFSGLADFLSYQTPVFGPPWALPFEFPLYQALVKGLHAATGVSLESCGRLVSIAFFLLCFWPLHCLLRNWQVRSTPWVMAAVLLTPLYVFWSRTFMIETMALFFALAYLALFARALRPGRGGAGDLLLLTAAGLLAALVKVTTVLPLLLVTGGVTAWLGLGAARRREGLARPLALAACHVVILAAAMAWVAHTDAVKLLNPWAAGLTSSALRKWNFGTLGQRLDPSNWFSLFNRAVNMFFPFPQELGVLKAMLATGWVLLFAWFLWRCTPARRRQAALLCGLFVLPFALFTNLHLRHNYYQSANAVFLCSAFGLAAYGAYEAAADASRAARTLVGYAAALLVFALCSAWYLGFNDSREGKLLAVSSLVRQASPPDSVIVVSGLEWSSVLPYQASRRALMMPLWATPELLAAGLARLRSSGVAVSLYVACGDSPPLDRELREAFALGERKPLGRADDCAVYPLRLAAS